MSQRATRKWVGMREIRHGSETFARAARGVALAAAVVTGAGAAAARPDDVFTIANYPVEASDVSAVAAKDKAMADGQRAAFRSLLKRIVPVTAYKQIARVQGENAAGFVAAVSVRSERNSATDYIANLDYRFDGNAVRAALSRNGVAFVDEQAGTVLVVPVIRQGNPATSSGDKGLWRRAWAGLDLAHSVTPVELGELKAQIHNDTVDQLLSGDDSALRILATEYGSERVVLAIAEPDAASKKVKVTLAGRDAVGGLLLKRDYRIPQGDLAYASELAAVVSLGIIEGRWKEARSTVGAAAAPVASQGPVWSTAVAGGGEAVSFEARFAGLGQWNEMRTQLLDTPGVEGLEIVGASETSAMVSLRYPSGVRGLANALGGRGLVLLDDGSGLVLQRR